MYLSILALPLFGSATAGLLGRKLGVTGAHIVTTGCLMSSALLSLVAFYEVGLCNSPVSIELFSWIDSESLLVQWGFLFDSLTVSMLLPVLVVSSLVHLYSISYMAEDPHNQRFFSYLSMFTFFMLVLVAGDNYLILFVGWEGIGISSYLLINFWYTRIQANKSGIKALTVNRVGDMFLSVGFFAILWVFGNVDYATVFSVAPYINETAITIIGLLLLVGAMAKSAQLGLHTWLPDAMEGPTPVSALIHAATLVTAGVYLMLRSSPIIEYGPTVLVVITWVGALTAFFAATTGLLQNDLKRVIAYSTCSQNLNYLLMAITLFLTFTLILNYDVNVNVLQCRLPPILLTLPKNVLHVITGCMLGDATITKRGNSRYFRMHMGNKRLNYLKEQLESTFKPFCLITKKVVSYTDGKSWAFNTQSLPIFTSLHRLWYQYDVELGKYVKIVPKFIEDIFSPLSLAHWLMNDGYFSVSHQTVYFCTDNFTKEECRILQKLLLNYNINSSVVLHNKPKNYYRIRVFKTSMPTLIDLVSSHMHPDFMYKLGK